MSSSDISPLRMGDAEMTEVEWQAEIELLASELEAAGLDGFPQLARELHDTLCAAPKSVLSALGQPCSRSRLDSLLASGAAREAAFELLGRAQYMLSRSGHDLVIASVVAPNLFPETTLSSEHEATAFTGALALGLRDWARAASAKLPPSLAH
jgi:hypothetical protein